MVHVIVTGGSSGIGLAVARCYLQQGAAVTLIGRDPGRLTGARDRLCGETGCSQGRIQLGQADVADEIQLESVIAAAEAMHGACDILVASAGVVAPAEFHLQEAQDFRRQIDTNLVGAVNAVRAVYAGMKARGRGKILVVSSGAALIGIFGYAAYCASKSALMAFVEALRLEATAHGIDVSICFPPDTDTPQLAAELQVRPAQAAAMMKAGGAWTAEAVASRIVRALDRNERTVYFTATIFLLGRFGSVVRPFVYWWFERKRIRLR
ncbi:SDR family oxidoreductase [Ciceribacter azotifigens]|uniref:SDR family oxidoreductase n=1 Tax=Ciceribacter azotifigens TaxID=2069303 RepID=UPI003A8446EF